MNQQPNNKLILNDGRSLFYGTEPVILVTFMMLFISSLNSSFKKANIGKVFLITSFQKRVWLH